MRDRACGLSVSGLNRIAMKGLCPHRERSGYTPHRSSLNDPVGAFHLWRKEMRRRGPDTTLGEWKWRDCGDGSRARIYKTHCAECEREVWRRAASLRSYANSFCSKKCNNAYMARTAVTMPCGECKAPVTRTASEFEGSASGLLFCSRSCSNAHRNRGVCGEAHSAWDGGTASYRGRGLREHGEACQNPRCPTAGNIDTPVNMLDVHHIDGNRGNGSEDNLIVLCVWCHATITRGLASIEDMQP